VEVGEDQAVMVARGGEAAARVVGPEDPAAMAEAQAEAVEDPVVEVAARVVGPGDPAVMAEAEAEAAVAADPPRK
jgi:hypothetical protein